MAAAAYASATKAHVTVPAWAWIGALIFALGPAFAMLPKFADGAVIFSAPIFDHAKVAIVDEMVRLGVPPGNPFFGEEGQPVAARLLLPPALQRGRDRLAARDQRLGGGRGAHLVQRLRLADADDRPRDLAQRDARSRRCSSSWSARPDRCGRCSPIIPGIDAVIMPPTGLAGWLSQTAWVPQHIASASCLVLAILLVCRAGAAGERRAAGGIRAGRRRRLRQLDLGRRRHLRRRHDLDRRRGARERGAGAAAAARLGASPSPRSAPPCCRRPSSTRS